MRVRFLTDRASLLSVWRSGEVYDLPTQEARRLLAAGTVEVAPEVEVETTTAPGASETSMLPPPAPRRRGRKRRSDG